MKKYIILTTLSIAIACTPTASFGEFYKYRDANGIMRFTDNIGEVPPDQRPKAERYSEPDDFITPEQNRQQKQSVETRKKAARNTRSDRTQQSETETPEQRAALLREQKNRLELEYNDIIKTQKALSQERKTLKTPGSYRAYNKKQSRLRKRAKSYENSREAFEEKVKSHNLSLEVSPTVK